MNEPRERSPAGASRRERGSSPWETAVLIHLSVLIVGLAWAFGGQIAWARQALLAWGSVGILLFLAAAGAKSDRSSVRGNLWPLLVFDVLAVASCFNPSFKSILREGEPYFMVVDPPYPWLPSSARPDLTWRALWQLNAIVLSCYNMVLVVKRPRILRRLLFVIAGNAVVLAVFGSFQKLAGAKGLWFGLMESRQTYFFSTFVYHNHWGAFTLLNAGACLGLLFHFWQRGAERDVWHTPVPAGALGVLLLAATIPLCGSRSCSLLIGLFLLGALLHVLVRLIRQRQARGASVAGPTAGVAVAAVLAVAAIGYLSLDVIRQRAQITADQLVRLHTEDTLNSRLALYRDTVRMASAKPWFGWGLETYGDVFRIYNSQRAVEVQLGQPYYREAHSDWLQLLAETGLVGFALMGWLVLRPLRHLRWHRVGSAIPRNLLIGCALVLLYAWLEFPFANPSVQVAFWCSLYLAARYAALDSGRTDASGSQLP